MRPTTRLLGRLRSKTISNVLNLHASSTPSFPWLSTLKTKQLQHLAQRTGLPSSGTKAILIEGLERGLALYRKQHKEKLFQCNEEPDNNGLAKVHGDGHGDGNGEHTELRILSIDMGIRNLAFAVLNVRGFGYGSSSGYMLGLLTERLEKLSQGRKKGKAARGLEGGSESEGAVQVSLKAWRRVSLPLDRGLSVEEFGRYLDSPYSAFSSASTLASAPLLEVDFESEYLHTNKGNPFAPSLTGNGKKVDKTSFSLPIYAAHAHSILSALLARYKPTHVLIERQRFRSGGGSAVQEWSLRVGVFEGMLWATLHSLRMNQNHNQKRAHQIGTAPRVISIEPARVGRFWAPFTTSSPSGSDVGSPAAAASDDGEGKKKERKKKTNSSREGKKLKIDLVGSWLEQDLFLTEPGHTVQPWVNAYMAKWKKTPKLKQGSKSKTKAKTKSTDSDLNRGLDADAVTVETGIDITKLDDMADCLVQGVTWLEWEGMKARIARKGIEGVVAGENGPA